MVDEKETTFYGTAARLGAANILDPRQAVAALLATGLISRAREINSANEEKRIMAQARRMADFLLAELRGEQVE